MSLNKWILSKRNFKNAFLVFLLLATFINARGQANNADLSNLVVSAGTLNPVFSASTLSYTVELSSEDSVNITPTTGTSTLRPEPPTPM